MFAKWYRVGLYGDVFADLRAPKFVYKVSVRCSRARGLKNCTGALRGDDIHHCGSTEGAVRRSVW